MLDRRHFLGALGAPLVAGCGLLDPQRAAVHLPPPDGRSPEEAARDEDYWWEVGRAFTVDRSMVNLNNGGVSPAPAEVQQAMARHLAVSNNAPAYTMWRLLEPHKETVRQRLARGWGVDPETVAITRNASEGLQICQFGFDLQPGDEVLTTDQDYPRMLNTFRQRQAREGIVLRTFGLPTPCEDDDAIVALFEQHITPRTRLILMCHMINLTGQVLPVKRVVAMARERGIPVIVDGAHAFAHLDYRLDELDVDYYATSLHKWLFAPIGTGMLHVRRERIGDLWPLMAAQESEREDIRKFEQIGTHPVAIPLAIAEALTFHEGIGGPRKEARMRFLKDYWAEALKDHERIRFHTSLDPRFSCGIANVTVDGIPLADQHAFLWKRHRIYTTTINHADFAGLRVSPSIYTTLPELDRFIDAMRHMADHGVDAA